MSEFYQDYSPASLGEDLGFIEEEYGGRLDVSSGGDLTSLAGENNLKAALFRRLTTPKRSIGRYVEDVTGLMAVNMDYGNAAFQWLSEPVNATTLGAIRDDIRECLAQEERIEVLDITNELVPYNNTVRVYYQIFYQVKGSAEMESLSLLQVNNTFLTE